MLLSILLSATFILLASLSIAIASARRLSTDSSPQDFLYGSNTPGLATYSNIGSVLSMYLIVAGLIPGVYGWGYPVVGAVFVGITLGSVLFPIWVRRIHSLRPVRDPDEQDSPHTLAQLMPPNSQRLLHVGQLCFYISAITC